MVVFLHGLHSSPLASSSYLEPFQNDPSISCFVPEILKRGNCKLEEVARPILEFLNQYDNKTHLILVGHSRGAVIGGYVGRNLRNQNADLISIGGHHGGSRWMTAVSAVKPHRFFNISKSVGDDGALLSDFAKEQMRQWQKNPDNGKRIFFASAQDRRIRPLNTCFPNLPNSQYVLIEGETHTGIIGGVKDDVIKAIYRLISDT